MEDIFGKPSKFSRKATRGLNYRPYIGDCSDQSFIMILTGFNVYVHKNERFYVIRLHPNAAEKPNSQSLFIASNTLRAGIKRLINIILDSPLLSQMMRLVVRELRGLAYSRRDWVRATIQDLKKVYPNLDFVWIPRPAYETSEVLGLHYGTFVMLNASGKRTSVEIQLHWETGLYYTVSSGGPDPTLRDFEDAAAAATYAISRFGRSRRERKKESGS